MTDEMILMFCLPYIHRSSWHKEHWLFSPVVSGQQMSKFLRLFFILLSSCSLNFFLNPSRYSAILFIIITFIIRKLFKSRTMTSHINYEMLINLSSIQIFCLRHSTFYQLRVSVYQVDKSNNSVFAIPFMILKTEKQSNTKQLKSFQNSNESEIDHQNHAFLTRRMIIRNMEDQSIDVNQICVFKGNFLLDKEGNINKEIRIFVQLLSYQQNQVEVLEEWVGTTLKSFGNSYCPIYFNSYRFTCNLHSSIHLMASSLIEKLPLFQSFPKQNGRNIKYLRFCSQNLQNSIQSMKQLIRTLNKIILNEIKPTKDSFNFNPNTYRYQLFSKTPILTQLTNQQISKLQLQINALPEKQLLQKIKDSLYLLNQVVFQYWKKIQLILTTKFTFYHLENMKKVYMQLLQQFHQGNNIINEQDDKPFKTITSSLMIYPFQQHNTFLKLKKKDMDSILACKKSSKMQLFVFVHGYQASSFDMEPISNYLKFKNSDIIVLLSNVNEGKTQQPIEQSAHRLAIEIKNFINSLQLKDFQINMVCHSLGGVIGRSCLKYLQLHKDKFNHFISLCSPHLGYLYHSSTLISTSLWILNMVKKDPSMIELTLSDNADLNKTFICDASKGKELNWFKKIWLFGSKEDEYVPYWSAILEDKNFFFETESSKVYKNMLENLTKDIEEKIIRCQIIFNQKTKDLSNFIGRTAHIKILNFIPGLALATSILPV